MNRFSLILYSWENWDPEWGINLSKITELINDETVIRTQVSVTSGSRLFVLWEPLPVSQNVFLKTDAHYALVVLKSEDHK